MKFLEILLICLSLSLDNFAVSASAGCDNKKSSFSDTFKICLAFTGAGIICLLAGFFGGSELGPVYGGCSQRGGDQ